MYKLKGKYPYGPGKAVEAKARDSSVMPKGHKKLDIKIKKMVLKGKKY